MFCSNFLTVMPKCIPGRDAKYCDPRVSMFVCLPVLFVISQKHISEFHQIFCTYYLWPWLCLSLTALFTSGFVDDVMFSRKKANGSDSKTTYVSSSSPGGGIGAKSVVSDCILL